MREKARKTRQKVKPHGIGLGSETSSAIVPGLVHELEDAFIQEKHNHHALEHTFPSVCHDFAVLAQGFNALMV